MTPAGIVPATFRFVVQHLNQCATAVSNRNKYQEYFLGGKGCRRLGLAALPPACANCIEIQEFQAPEILMACSGL